MKFVQVAASNDSHAIVVTKYFAMLLAGVARIPKQSWLLHG